MRKLPRRRRPSAITRIALLSVLVVGTWWWTARSGHGPKAVALAACTTESGADLSDQTTSPLLLSGATGKAVPSADLADKSMRLVFDDEFTGAQVSPAWSRCWCYAPHGCSNGDGEGEWYTASSVSQTQGSLDLSANRRQVLGVQMTTGAPRTYNYTSGMVTTQGSFQFSYGYAEWRAELPTGQGFWPALWMMPANNTWPPEIDALEVVGNQPDVGNFTYHPPSPATQDGFSKTIPGLSAGWHTFGVNWEPGQITWYVDGRPVASSTKQVTNTPLYLVMDLAVGGTWPGYPNSSTPFPSSLKIDYVRVWQPKA